MRDNFWNEWHEALDEFRLVQYVEDGPVRYAEAEAGTGSRYVVIGTTLPRAARESGVLVTVLQPWQIAWTMGERGYHSWDYVDEHLRSPRRGRFGSHGGDMLAVTVLAHLATNSSLDEALHVASMQMPAGVR